MEYVIVSIVSLVVGALGGAFVLRNNPPLYEKLYRLGK